MPGDEKKGLVEALIRAARERGDFENLPLHGKPLPEDELTGLDHEQRFDVLLLRTLGELPHEAALAREVRAARAALSALGSEGPESEQLRATLQKTLDELTAVLKAKRLARGSGGT